MKEELPKKAKQDENSEILDEIRKNDRHLRDLNERILTLVEEINEQLGDELFEGLLCPLCKLNLCGIHASDAR